MKGPLLRAVIGGLLALTGAALFRALSLPLPFILGPLAGSMLATNLVGPLPYNKVLRRSGQVVIGTALGGLLTPEALGALGSAMPLMIAMALCLNATGILLAFPVARIAGIDRLTALLSCLPAGMAEMASVARDMGARDHVVATVHALRVVLIITTLPLWIDLDGTSVVRDSVPLLATAVPAIVLVVVAGGGLAVAANHIGILNPWILAPLVFSVCALGLGSPVPAMPNIFLIIAQIAIGAALGTRFDLTALREMPRAALAGLFSTAVLMGVAFGLLMPLVTMAGGIDRDTALLAVAPGGLGEMIASAKALGLASVTVAGFQFVRAVMTNVLVPPVVRLIAGRIRRPDDPGNPLSKV